MGVQEHVFVGQTDVGEWADDDETGGLVHMLREDTAVIAGLWKPGQMGSSTRSSLSFGSTALRKLQPPFDTPL
jgi:hypothetical protein